MLRRIWAVVSERDFYEFRQRIRDEGIDMGAALAALAHAYAKGVKIDISNAKEH